MSGPSGGLAGTGPGAASRFTTQNQTVDQRLSNTTVGLVELSDFRKRRAEVLEQQEREAREAAAAGSTPANGTPDRSQTGTPMAMSGGEAGAATAGSEADEDTSSGPLPKKKKTKSGKDLKREKKKKAAAKASKLSFLGDEDEEEEEEAEQNDEESTPTRDSSRSPGADDLPVLKSFTKQALRRQAAEREALRKEFLALQAAVKATEVAIPFVFYEGANIPGGVVRVKKGDPVWLFLDRSRKVGARLGVGAGADKKPSKAQLHWARINVDDLMLVRGNLIIPHHYDIYFFIINKTVGPGGVRVFDYSGEAPTAKPEGDAAGKSGSGLSNPLSKPSKPGTDRQTAEGDDADAVAHLEGARDDPALTKVVDRRWYERNKHIYPASLWQEFDPEHDYAAQVRRDQGGNAFFFTAK